MTLIKNLSSRCVQQNHVTEVVHCTTVRYSRAFKAESVSTFTRTFKFAVL